MMTIALSQSHHGCASTYRSMSGVGSCMGRGNGGVGANTKVALIPLKSLSCRELISKN